MNHTCVIYCAPGSSRKWNNIRQALSPLGKCTQDGDDEGVIRIDALPTPEQAVLIRKAIGLSKRPAVNPEVVKANLFRPSVWPVQGHSTRPGPAHRATQEAAEWNLAAQGLIAGRLGPQSNAGWLQSKTVWTKPSDFRKAYASLLARSRGL